MFVEQPLGIGEVDELVVVVVIVQRETAVRESVGQCRESGRRLPSGRPALEVTVVGVRNDDALAVQRRAGLGCAAEVVLGSLEAVVEFASLAFIVVFGTMSALALTVRDSDEVDVNPIPPLLDVIGSAAFFVMLTWYLYSQLPAGFWLVVVIAVVVFGVEAVYFKRQTLSEGVNAVEKRI